MRCATSLLPVWCFWLLLYCALILCMSAFPECYIRQWTEHFAIRCVLRYSRTVLLRSEHGTGWCVVERQLVSGQYQPRLWRCVLHVFCGVFVALVVSILNCDNSTQCSVTTLHSSQCIRFSCQTAFCTGGHKPAVSVAWTLCYQICKTKHQLFAQHLYLLINATTCFGLNC